jgi:hypothetical protein
MYIKASSLDGNPFSMTTLVLRLIPKDGILDLDQTHIAQQELLLYPIFYPYSPDS